jgi:type II secretory pathway pseudopilin PulG
VQVELKHFFGIKATMRNQQSVRASMRSRNGFVLPTIVFAVAIMSIIVVAALSTSSDERRASRAVRESTLATYAAESGLRQTFGAWPTASVNAMNPGDSLDLGWQDLPNSAKYRTVIHRVDKGGLQEYDVVVQGRRAELNGGVSTVLGVVGGVPVFRGAVITQSGITMSGGTTLDAYDSEVAAYNPLAPDSMANIYSNGNISLQKTTLLGDATSSGTINLGSGGNLSTVSGAVNTGITSPTQDINACPVGGFTSNASIPSIPGVTYNSGTGVLSLASGANLTLTLSQYYFSRVIIAGNATLTVNPPAGNHIEVIVSDSLNTTGGSISNVPGDPTRLGFSSCGTPNPLRKWAIAGGAGAAFSIYAPNHDVTLAGGGEVYGAIVGNSFTLSGGGKLHYDEALARQASKKLAVQRATWSMLAGY